MLTRWLNAVSDHATLFDWLSLAVSLACLAIRTKLRHLHFSSSEACVISTAVNLVLLLFIKVLFFIFNCSH